MEKMIRFNRDEQRAIVRGRYDMCNAMEQQEPSEEIFRTAAPRSFDSALCAALRMTGFGFCKGAGGGGEMWCVLRGRLVSRPCGTVGAFADSPWVGGWNDSVPRGRPMVVSTELRSGFAGEHKCRTTGARGCRLPHRCAMTDGRIMRIHRSPCATGRMPPGRRGRRPPH